jgi:hypothetical protein
MKYFDKNTRINNYKYENRQPSDPEQIRQRKLLKDFSTKVLNSGFDSDWWSLVSKDDKWILMCNFSYRKQHDKSITLKMFILERQDEIEVDLIKLRDIKLSKLLKSF